MFAIVKKTLSVVVLVLMATAAMGCLNVNKPPEDRPDRTTTVGGEHGVVVERSNAGTEVKVGGDRGVVVDAPRK